MTGVTGSKAADLAAAAARAGALQAEIATPVALGFGVRTKEDVALVAPHADGVVVGSAVVRVIEEAPSDEAAVELVQALVSDLAQGLPRP